MIKRYKAIAIGLPLVASAMLLSTPTASADLNACDSGKFCAWTDDAFRGTIAEWPRATDDADWWNNGMHDNAESVFNNAASSSTVRDNVQTYYGINYSGTQGACVHPGEAFDSGMNDNEYDSHSWVHTC
ncbi:MAG TPA: peptidase inhibitor family I36 protein [Kribbella sp.]|uniref:peptidase inhibitor family I36 protein n=1 Tax=Kribbella sp. TaxID=1871183 RepID=UPI002D797213|nr:peptidase inhibitor family I36 protein [Kribbella sp.]HET6295047.1 peptidase inhibitor family I36 protein [Kribbella sp.]